MEIVSPTDALKRKIINTVRGTRFFAEAEELSRPNAAFGESNTRIMGKCDNWSYKAKGHLETEGLEVLPMCTTYWPFTPNHYFLLVRDPTTHAVVYYDPSAEQYGIRSAHHHAYTRQEIDELNKKHGMRWLEQPLVAAANGELDYSWNGRHDAFETLRQKWGQEIGYTASRVELGRGADTARR